MPKVSKIARHVSLYEEAFIRLNKLCETNSVYPGVWKEDTYIFELESKKYMSHDGPAMIAVQEYQENKYAIYAPEYLRDNQLAIFEYFFGKLEKGAQVRVFSQRTYNAIKKCYKGNDVNIIYNER